MELQGVETPSQIRYLQYLDKLLRNQQAFLDRPPVLPPEVRVPLVAVRFEGVFKNCPESELLICVQEYSLGRYLHVTYWSEPFRAEEGEVFLNGAEASGDVRISVFDKSLLEDAR